MSSEITADSPARVVFWEPQSVVLTRYVYPFLYCSGCIQDRFTAVVFKVTAPNPVTLYGPANIEECVTF